MKDNECICHDCEHCLYIGEGDSICDMNYEMVLSDWVPTNKFNWCGGKNYIQN